MIIVKRKRRKRKKKKKEEMNKQTKRTIFLLKLLLWKEEIITCCLLVFKWIIIKEQYQIRTSLGDQHFHLHKSVLWELSCHSDFCVKEMENKITIDANHLWFNTQIFCRANPCNLSVFMHQTDKVATHSVTH